MENIKLYSKLATLPENLKSEVSDFIDFLLSKTLRDKKNSSITKPKFGSAKGMFKVSVDFDEPLGDFQEYTH
ncbi:MAG: DUF2281 domain-containing protein [Bacteroidota bacterium]|nr:DUF2281 domain-containing protein [Bacteroidota bacterium]